MTQQNSEEDLEHNQLRKMRRRIEEFLRHTTPDILIRTALICKITVPDKLKKKYLKNL